MATISIIFILASLLFLSHVDARSNEIQLAEESLPTSVRSADEIQTLSDESVAATTCEPQPPKSKPIFWCSYPREEPTPTFNGTVVKIVNVTCPAECENIQCVNELNRGCELIQPIGGPQCLIKDKKWPWRQRCVPLYHQLGPISCRICNTSADSYDWTLAYDGWSCNNTKWCDGHDICRSTQCVPASSDHKSCPNPAMTCSSSTCTEKYRCNAPPLSKCSNITLHAEVNDDRCDGKGNCEIRLPITECTIYETGRYCFSPTSACPTVKGRCSPTARSAYCNFTCPIPEPVLPWWQSPMGVVSLGTVGGVVVLALFTAAICVYYRRKHAKLQAHLTTLYWKMDQVEKEEVSEKDMEKQDPDAKSPGRRLDSPAVVSSQRSINKGM